MNIEEMLRDAQVIDSREQEEGLEAIVFAALDEGEDPSIFAEEIVQKWKAARTLRQRGPGPKPEAA